MAVITILGAGAMGSALATPLTQAGWETRLWGTWLDDHLIDACEAGDAHPRTKVPLASGTALYRSDDLDEALDGADAVFIAVASGGVPKVTELALPAIAKASVLLCTSKGFWTDRGGRVRLLPDAIRTIAAENGALIPPIVAVGGPCKANEVAAGKPTATIYGSLDEASRGADGQGDLHRRLSDRADRGRAGGGGLRADEERVRDRVGHRRRFGGGHRLRPP